VKKHALRLAVASILGALWTGLSLGVGVGPVRAQETITIGAIAQLSGAAAFLGPSEKAAYEMAVKEINEKGGVLGKQLKVIVADDATDPATANNVAKRLLGQDNVAALFGSTTSASREAILQVVKRSGKTLFFYNAIYEGRACDPRMFIMGEVPENQIAPIVPYLQETKGGNTWFFVGNDYNWPQNTATVARKVIADSKGSLVGETLVPIGTTDFAPILQKIASAKPKFVLLVMLPSDAVAFMRQFHNQGLDTSTISIATLVEQSAIEAMGPAREGLLIPAGFFDDATPEAKAFGQRYRQAMGEGAPRQNFISINGYDSVRLWTLAVDKAKSIEADAVAKALPTVSFEGPRGTVSYSAKTHHATLPIYLARIDADGTPHIEKAFGPVDAGPQCNF
jgi:urea transport system substrate-binding protein